MSRLHDHIRRTITGLHYLIRCVTDPFSVLYEVQQAQTTLSPRPHCIPDPDHPQHQGGHE